MIEISSIQILTISTGLSQRANHPRDQLKLLHGTLFDIKCFNCKYVEQNNVCSPNPQSQSIANISSTTTPSTPFSPSTQHRTTAWQLPNPPHQVIHPKPSKVQPPPYPAPSTPLSSLTAQNARQAFSVQASFGSVKPFPRTLCLRSTNGWIGARLI